MSLIMKISEIKTVSQIENLLQVTEDLSVSFSFSNKKELYDSIRNLLIQLRYYKLPKKQKGIVKKFLQKITGYCGKQIKRLIKKYKNGKLFWQPWQNNSFRQVYTREDIWLLHEVDKIHKCLAGPATKKILEAEYRFGKIEFHNLANISSSHIYNLRQSQIYTRQGVTFDKTKPANVQIGIRKKPRPCGSPGFLRVDTVHQGDYNGMKGVYWINIIDEVTQYEFLFCVPSIEHQYVIRILDLLFWLCPFEILNFHSDNGSEYINQYVAAVLNGQNIQQTKSRPRKSNDNGLVETKNGSVVRKYFGRNYIPATEKNAKLLTQFCIDWFIPYLNYHRPCGFSKEQSDQKGKIKNIFKPSDYQTPYEKLKSLPNAEKYLKSGITFHDLDKFAYKYSPSDFAVQMNQNFSIISQKLFS